MSSVLATLVISPELCDKAGGRGSIILLYPYLSGQQQAPIEKRRLLQLAAEAVYIKGSVLVGVQPTFSLLPLTTMVDRMEEVVSCGPNGIRTRDLENVFWFKWVFEHEKHIRVCSPCPYGFYSSSISQAE